jgi:hypothetical protein
VEVTMPLYRRAIGAALAACAAAPGAAGAAQIQTDRLCYLNRPTTAMQTVTLTGAGFTPAAPYQATLDGRPLTLENATADTTGAITTVVQVRLADQPAPAIDHTYTLAVQQGANTATTQFTLSDFKADFRPARGNPKTLRVRFRAFAFGLDVAQDDPRPDVYLHYIRPNGRLRTTIRLGRAKGACGTLLHTRLRRLFPFNAERGTWRLQFDTHKRFARGTDKSNFVFYTIGVRIRRLAR